MSYMASRSSRTRSIDHRSIELLANGATPLSLTSRVNYQGGERRCTRARKEFREKDKQCCRSGLRRDAIRPVRNPLPFSSLTYSVSQRPNRTSHSKRKYFTIGTQVRVARCMRFTLSGRAIRSQVKWSYVYHNRLLLRALDPLTGVHSAPIEDIGEYI